MKRVHEHALVEALEPRRFLSAGDLDATFGDGGAVVENLPGTPNGVAVEADGKIIVTNATKIFCFNTDGTPDTSFGTNGEVTLASSIVGMALQSDGKIVVAGSNMAHYNEDGTPDTTFGVGGVAALASPTVGVAIGPGGEIVTGGGSGSEGSQDVATGDFYAEVLDADGTPDDAFGSNGVAEAPLSFAPPPPEQFATASALALAVSGSGTVVVGGTSTDGLLESGLTAARFSSMGAIINGPSQGYDDGGDIGYATLTNGSLVAMTNTSGSASDTSQIGVSAAFTGFSNGVLCTAPNAQIIEAASGERHGEILLGRLRGRGALDDTFGVDGSVALGAAALGRSPRTAVHAVASAPDGNIVIAGTANGSIYLARILGGSNSTTQKPTATFEPSTLAAHGRRQLTFHVVYTAGEAIDLQTLGNRDVFLNGPRRFSEAATVAAITTVGISAVDVTYDIDTGVSGFPTGTHDWDITLAPRTIRDNFGVAVHGGVIGTFRRKLR